ncbi:MAG: polysulfide reductase NrfD, partial [Chloroflexi bacterium]|nr:polysulfide reductase NrfD [Chloroflexota bacterium]
RPWGRRVSGYLWTKAIGGGVLLTAALLALFGTTGGTLVNLGAPLLALFFTALTTALLVLDLKRPDRFHFVLFRPNTSSWLVLGAWVLIAYSVASALWLLASLSGGAGTLGVAIRWVAAALGAAAAGYSAFLFGQAEGRDFWQSPLLLPQLLAGALVAGAASLLVAVSLVPRWLPAESGTAGLSTLLMIGLLLLALLFFAELFTPHANMDVSRAARLLSHGVLAPVFWGGVVVLGIVAPLGLLALGGSAPGPIAAVAAVGALAGLLIYEDLWLQAGQYVPLS